MILSSVTILAKCNQKLMKHAVKSFFIILTCTSQRLHIVVIFQNLSNWVPREHETSKKPQKNCCFKDKKKRFYVTISYET